MGSIRLSWKVQFATVMLLPMPLGADLSTRTVPQPNHSRPAMPKSFAVTVRAVKVGDRQVMLLRSATSCTDPTISGSAAVSIREAGSTRVVLLGPVAAMICCAR